MGMYDGCSREFVIYDTVMGKLKERPYSLEELHDKIAIVQQGSLFGVGSADSPPKITLVEVGIMDKKFGKNGKKFPLPQNLSAEGSKIPLNELNYAITCLLENGRATPTIDGKFESL